MVEMGQQSCCMGFDEAIQRFVGTDPAEMPEKAVTPEAERERSALRKLLKTARSARRKP